MALPFAPEKTVEPNGGRVELAQRSRTLRAQKKRLFARPICRDDSRIKTNYERET